MIELIWSKLHKIRQDALKKVTFIKTTVGIGKGLAIKLVFVWNLRKT